MNSLIRSIHSNAQPGRDWLLRLTLAAWIPLSTPAVWSQTADAVQASKPMHDLVAKMTVNEKLDFITGTNHFSIPGIPRLGWPEIVTANGPTGVRRGVSQGVRYAPSDLTRGNAFPAPIALAASWNRDLLERVGTAVASECRARGVGVLLGPTVCIVRNPYGGRNFESFGEDPYLTGEMAVPIIQGIQAHGVVATVKHFAANNQEFDRFNIRENIDERAMREIYLPAFEAAIQRGGSGSIMSAYPSVNGEFCSENRWLLNDVLKREWGFKGFVMSDWWATQHCDTVGMVHNGLDLEMPSGIQWTQANLHNALDQGRISMAEIDEKVRRILQTLHRIGADDPAKAAPFDDQKVRQATLEAARESIVLLKNNNKILPLDLANTQSIAVIGPNAAHDQYGGGGSSRVNPDYTVSPLEGIRRIAGENVAVRFVRGCVGATEIRPIPANFLRCPDTDALGLDVSYYNNPTFTGPPILKRIERQLGLSWKSTDIPPLLPAAFSVRYHGRLRFDEPGEYKLIIRAEFGSAKLFIDGKQVLATAPTSTKKDETDEFRPPTAPKKPMPGPTSANSRLSNTPPTKAQEFLLTITEPKLIEVRFDYVCPKSGAPSAFVQLIRPGENAGLAEAVTAARQSDVCVVCVGLNSQLESEGKDLKSITLSTPQVKLIRRVSQANPRTIVVLNNGTPLMIADWVEEVPALVEAFYPGEEGGTALAEILFGKVNPSAKLPFSFYRKPEDCLALKNYPTDSGKKSEVTYNDGIFVGYRHLDTANIKPLFAFGSGFSYTKFTYDHLKLSTTQLKGDDTMTVSLDVTNSGSCAGAESVQLYIRDLKASVDRPLKELKGFAKVLLQPGETKTVSLSFGSRALSFWDIKQHRWNAENGEFQALIGDSSANIRLTGEFHYQN